MAYRSLGASITVPGVPLVGDIVVDMPLRPLVEEAWPLVLEKVYAEAPTILEGLRPAIDAEVPRIFSTLMPNIKASVPEIIAVAKPTVEKEVEAALTAAAAKAGKTLLVGALALGLGVGAGYYFLKRRSA